jgi:hypothetical protein
MAVLQVMNSFADYFLNNNVMQYTDRYILLGLFKHATH